MWNSEATPARIIEVLAPGRGSERWFEESAALQPGDTEGFRASCQRHGIEFFPGSPWLQKLQERYRLCPATLSTAGPPHAATPTSGTHNHPSGTPSPTCMSITTGVHIDGYLESLSKKYR